MTAAWQVPSRWAALWWRCRVAGHVVLRGLRHLLRGQPPRHTASPRLADAPVRAEHRSPLWSDGRPEEFALVAGKVHNLRIAARAFDGLFVPAGQPISFWRQLGRPSRWRGFVQGRELRAGCVVPTVAGGLCQLSNALATSAARAGIEIIERHGHTARIEAAPSGPMDAVDATVLWNYVDLQLRAPFDLRIECTLTADELVLRLRAPQPADATAPRRPALPLRDERPPAAARGCISCSETGCFRHGRGRSAPGQGRRALLLSGWTPEWAQHLASHGAADWHVPWVRPARRAAGHWQAPADARLQLAWVPSLRRTLALRRAAGEGGSRQSALLRSDAWLAASHASALKPHHTHLLVDQSLLATLWQHGALGGRRFEVLAGSLPAIELQTRLDAAHRLWPAAASLADFRADPAHAQAEWQALQRAERVWTAHHDAARWLAERGIPVGLLDWVAPAGQTAATRRKVEPPLVVFPASALARKGALELAASLRKLGWRLRVLGTASTDPSLWAGVTVEHGRYGDRRWLAEADVVALPAHVEHAPRALLAALAAGLPVVATAACGLPPQAGLFEVPTGDVAALTRALQEAVASTG